MSTPGTRAKWIGRILIGIACIIPISFIAILLFGAALDGPASFIGGAAMIGSFVFAIFLFIAFVTAIYTINTYLPKIHAAQQAQLDALTALRTDLLQALQNITDNTHLTAQQTHALRQDLRRPQSPS